MNKNNIPKIIHQTFCNTKNLNIEVQNNINLLKKLNPGYQHFLYDNNDIVEFIKNNYDNNILQTYFKINPDYGPARADYFRYLLLYKKGGIYLDIKSICTKPFDSIIKSDDEYILTHWDNFKYWNRVLNNELGEYCNWNIIIRKNHPLMKLIIEQITYNINNYNVKKDGVLFITGPVAYSRVILNNKDKYNLTVYNNYSDIGLVYSSISNYRRIFKKHYTQLSTPIIYNYLLF